LSERALGAHGTVRGPNIVNIEYGVTPSTQRQGATHQMHSWEAVRKKLYKLQKKKSKELKVPWQSV
jgi:hypothetical protein